LVLGAAILWLRLHQVHLPPEVPVSLAGREELIAIGAQAVAVWVLLAGAIGILAAWIVTGDPRRRGFDYYEAALALAVTVAMLLALRNEHWMILLPSGAALITVLGALLYWPSLEAVTTVVVPVAVGLALALSLHALSHGSGIATAAGAAVVFGSMLLLTPPLQRWRARQEINQGAAEGIEARCGDPPERGVQSLLEALKSGPQRQRSRALIWVERITAAAVALIALGAIAVASQIDRDEDFHQALVALTNGNCIEGTYVARGHDQVVIAQPRDTGAWERSRITTIPTKEVLEVQVYGKSGEGVSLRADEKCLRSPDDLVAPTPRPGPAGGIAVP
jgi:hypothetical protein